MKGTKEKKSLSTASHSHPTTKYALELIAGKYICCSAELQLAKKHIRDLERQGTKGFPYVFDESRANRFFRYYNVCKNVDTGEYYVILPHQQFDNGLEYGWVHKDTGNRKYTKVYKQEAKGQAKTTSCAIKAMYALTADKIYKPSEGENSKNGRIVPNVEVHLMAVDSEQARELREPIVTISQNSEALVDEIDARKTYIRGTRNGGWIRVLSADLANKQGGKPNVVIIDELSSHRDGKRAAVAEGNLGKKGQQLLEIITTAGDNEMTNPAKREYDYAKKILSGEIDDEESESYLPIIREVEENDDIHDFKNWQKSHPMFRYLGKSAYADNLFKAVKKLYTQAYLGDDAELQRQFLTFRMNMWQERAVNSYLSQKNLKRLDSLKVTMREWDNLTYGRDKIIGLDFAVKRDLTAVAEVFLLDDGRIAIDAKGYILKNRVIEKEHTDKVPYRDWIKKGWIEEVDGDYMNARVVAEDFLSKAKENSQDIVMACFDESQVVNMMVGMIDGTYGDGQFNEENTISIPQNAKMLNAPTVLLRNSIIESNIVWNGNPVLRWCLTNCFEFVNKVNGNIIVGKEDKDSHKRIDLAAAVILALKKFNVLKDKDDLADRIIKYGFSS